MISYAVFLCLQCGIARLKCMIDNLSLCNKDTQRRGEVKTISGGKKASTFKNHNFAQKLFESLKREHTFAYLCLITEWRAKMKQSIIYLSFHIATCTQ